MKTFYSDDMFTDRYEELIKEGHSPAKAYQIVKAEESEDHRKYQQWLDENSLDTVD